MLGVVDENLRRLQAGKPISLDLGELLVAAHRGVSSPSKATLRLALMYGKTHREIVDEIGQAAPVPAELVDAANRLDARLREEGLL